MSDSDHDGPSGEPPRRGFWAKLRARLSRNPDKGLRESLEGAIKIHAAQNPSENFGKEAKSMMLNIIEFSELRVDDVMVPRVDIMAIDETASLRQLMERFTEAGHSRLPVYRETLDGITGMVHLKDLMGWMMAKGAKKRRSRSEPKGEAKPDAKPEKPATGLSIAAAELSVTVRQSGLHREVLFVPPSMPATDLLVKMQANHIHLAIVIDEYGGTDGLVSIEDLVEEIVGDISDEHDTEEDSLLKPAGDGLYVALGRVGIARLEETLGVDLMPDEDDEETDTLAGLIFKMGGRVPARGEIIRHASGLEFEILDSDPRRVKRVKIHVKTPHLPPAEASPGDTNG
ncbi:MAG: HlyC/CorC family transporter [Rhizobiales bacterium]|nr:HlyC/CorC family transporter [Hyphomicrobiales bacterium]MBI3673256.1 HlyC/CorC family transporter [Hyphomicrobiales bacterium]